MELPGGRPLPQSHQPRSGRDEGCQGLVPHAAARTTRPGSSPGVPHEVGPMLC